MTPLLCGVLMLAVAQDGPPLVLERTFGDDRWLASPERFERVALSPDGRRLAASSRDTRLQVWDVEGRRLVHEATFGQAAQAVDLLLPDADTLLVAHADGFLRAYALAAPGKPSAERKIPERARLWAAPSAAEVYVGPTRLDWKSGEVKLRLQAPSEVRALAATEARIFTGHATEVVEWDATTGAQLQRRPFDRKVRGVTALAVHADGKRLVSGHDCGRLLEWSPEPRIVLEQRGGAHPIQACGWVPAGGPAVGVDATGSMHRAGAKDAWPQKVPVLGAADAAFARGGALVAVAEAPAQRKFAEVPVGWNHPGPWSIVLWDTKAGFLWRPEGGAHDRRILDAAVRGSRLVTQSLDAVLLWDLASGAALAKIVDEPRGFAVDEKRLLTSSAAGLLLWDLETGKRLAGIADAVGWGVGLRGRRAVLSRGEEVDVWDLETGKKEGTVAAGGSVDAVHAHADAGRVVLSLSRAFAVLDVERREIVGRVQGRFLEKALSVDGRHAALLMDVADGYDYQVVETATARVLGRLARRDPAVGLAFQGPALWIRFAGHQVVRWDWAADKIDEHALTRPVGALLPLDARRAMISSGTGLHEVDLATDRWSAAATGHKGSVGGLILLEGGKSVLSYGADRTARLWSRKSP